MSVKVHVDWANWTTRQYTASFQKACVLYIVDSLSLPKI